MPDWKKIGKTVAKAAGEVAREAAAESARQRSTPRTPKSRTNVCVFWDCDRSIRPDHTLCYDHYLEAQDGQIDDCPSCGRGKYATYEFCLDCKNKPTARRRPTRVRETSRRYKPESSQAWDKGDAGVDEFFVYLLKLDGADGARFYAGHTRELRERLSEHRDGNSESTAGRNPQLVWFEIFPSRKLAAEQEAELKKLIDDNPREIRRRIIKFQDLVDEVKEL